MRSLTNINIADILQQNTAYFTNKLPSVAQNLVASDPAMVLIDLFSYKQALLLNKINQAMDAINVDIAVDDDLDVLAGFYNLTRKTIQPQTDTEAAILEDNESLRERIKDAPKSFSVAGPKTAYQHFGKEASNDVKDIKAISNSPMEVDIIVLSYKNNGVASDDLLTIVKNKLNAEDIRPMGDKLTVTSAEIVEYNVKVKLIFKDNIVLDKEETTKQVMQNLLNYTLSTYKLGGVVSLVGILGSCAQYGVADVELIEPLANIIAADFQAPRCLKIEVN